MDKIECYMVSQYSNCNVGLGRRVAKVLDETYFFIK